MAKRLLLILVMALSTISFYGQRINLEYGEFKQMPEELSNDYKMIGYQTDGMFFLKRNLKAFDWTTKIWLTRTDHDFNVKKHSITETDYIKILDSGVTDDCIYTINNTTREISLMTFDKNTLQQNGKRVLLSNEQLHIASDRFDVSLRDCPLSVYKSPHDSLIVIAQTLMWAPAPGEPGPKSKPKVKGYCFYTFDKDFNQLSRVEIPCSQKGTNLLCFKPYDNGTLVIASLVNRRDNPHNLTRSMYGIIPSGKDFSEAESATTLHLYILAKKEKKDVYFGFLSESLNITNPLIIDYDGNSVKMQGLYSKYYERRSYDDISGLQEGRYTFDCNLNDKSIKITQNLKFDNVGFKGEKKKYWSGGQGKLKGIFVPTTVLPDVDDHIVNVNEEISSWSRVGRQKFTWYDSNYRNQKHYVWGESSDDDLKAAFMFMNRFYRIEVKGDRLIARSYNYDGNYEGQDLGEYDKNSSVFPLGDNKWVVWQIRKEKKGKSTRVGLMQPDSNPLEK